MEAWIILFGRFGKRRGTERKERKMKFQPNRDYKSNDEVMTPLKMAEKIVKHFNPTGKILEPCCGDGSFLRFLNGANETAWH